MTYGSPVLPVGDEGEAHRYSMGRPRHSCVTCRPTALSWEISVTRRKWSQQVTEHSDALDLDKGVFKKDDPKEIAQSLKRSAEHSERRKGTPLQSAMSMLTFYINRAGDNLSKAEHAKLEKAKDELRDLFGVQKSD
jgi:hypothetical protein